MNILDDAKMIFLSSNGAVAFCFTEDKNWRRIGVIEWDRRGKDVPIKEGGHVHDLGRVCMGFSTPSMSVTPPPALVPPSPLCPPLPACTGPPPRPVLFLSPFEFPCVEEEDEEVEEANRGCCGPSAARGKTTYHKI